MHSRFYWIFLLLLGTHSVLADSWPWAQQLSVPVAAVATDAAGNSYVLGGFAGTAQLGTTTLTSHPLYSGDTDAYLAKFSPAGTLQWVTTFGGAYASVRPAALAVDAAGNCYFTGTVRGTVEYGVGQQLPGVPEWPQVLTGRCSAAGQISWLRRDGSNSYASIGGRAIAVDATGNCYVAGAATTPFVSGGAGQALRYQVYVASYSPSGTLRWSDIGQSPTMFNNGLGLALDGQGGGYVAGFYTGSLTLAGHTLSSAGARGFLGRFRATNGRLDWLQNLDANVSYLSSLGADFQGPVLAGQYSAATTFQGQALPHSGGQDAFVARFTRLGTFRWVRPLPATPGDDTPVAVHCDGAGGNIVLVNQLDARRGSGPLQNNTLLTALNAFGQAYWTSSLSGTPSITGTAFAVDATFHVCWAGTFDTSAQLGPYTLSGGPGTTFLARLSGGAPDMGRPGTKPALTLAPIAEVSVFPNPASTGSSCFVQLPASADGPTQFTLLNQLGQVVRQTSQLASTAGKPVELQTQSLPRGLYTLRVRWGTTSLSRPLLIQ